MGEGPQGAVQTPHDERKDDQFDAEHETTLARTACAWTPRIFHIRNPLRNSFHHDEPAAQGESYATPAINFP